MSEPIPLRSGLWIGTCNSAQLRHELDEWFKNPKNGPTIRFKIIFRLKDIKKPADVEVKCHIDLASPHEHGRTDDGDGSSHKTPHLQISVMHKSGLIGIGSDDRTIHLENHESLLTHVVRESIKLEGEAEKQQVPKWKELWEREPEAWQKLWSSILVVKLKTLDKDKGKKEGKTIFPETAIYPLGNRPVSKLESKNNPYWDAVKVWEAKWEHKDMTAVKGFCYYGNKDPRKS